MNIIVYVAHIDDDILGAGGYIKRCSDDHNISIVYATNGVLHRPKTVSLRENAIKSAKILGVDDVHFLGFSNQEFDRYPLIEINKEFEGLNLNPDLIITNDKNDVNQDHRMIYDSALVVGRECSVMTCEVLSSSEWYHTPFNPILYVDITDSIESKLEAIKCMPTELKQYPHPRSLEGIKIKARQRGMEAGVEYAEAFDVVRLLHYEGIK